MALLMAAGSEPVSDREREDLDAIAALKESSAIEFKEQGNKYVKMGKKHYSDAIDCYSRAISQNALSDSDQSVLFSNRAHVNLMLGNYRRAFMDAEQAIKLCPTNVKGYYRAAKAAFSLELMVEAELFCNSGLEQSPNNEEMKKLFVCIISWRKEHEHKKDELLKFVKTAKELLSAFRTRGLRLGRAMYQELTGVKIPLLDESGILHWPVLFLYPETMSSDFIEEFCETDLFSAHLDMMYSENCSTLSWDKENAYKREVIELYYQADRGVLLSEKKVLEYLLQDRGVLLSEKKVLEYLLQDTANLLAECVWNEDVDEIDHTEKPSPSSSGKWIKVSERKTLNDILRSRDYIIPAIPVFFVVSKRSRFYKEFRAGHWSQP